MLVMVIVTIVSATAIPQLLAGLDRSRAVAAARYLAQQCGIARFQAVGQGRYVALQFTQSGNDYVAQMFADGNRNGVRAVDIAAGVDVPLLAAVSLSTDFSGPRIALDPALGLGVNPIRLGGTTLLSFSPAGTATAGSVYVLGRDGTQLVVRVLGVTGRTRVLRYQRATNAWEQP
jgi:type II secretory pathway pseudopilin PulG